MQAWMLFEPGTRLEAVMTTEIVGDDEDIARRIIGLNVSEQSNVAFGMAREGTAGQFLAIAHP
jgi:hypothetical protein